MNWVVHEDEGCVSYIAGKTNSSLYNLINFKSNFIFQKSFWVDMAESMKQAWKGQGSGLQGASSTVGNLMTEETQSSGQKKATEANESLTEMASGNKKSGPTVGTQSVDAAQQSANQQTGSADHLGVSMRK